MPNPSLRWRVPLRACLTLLIAAPCVAAAPRQILDAGRPDGGVSDAGASELRLRGINVAFHSLARSPALAHSAFQKIESWGANSIRMPLHLNQNRDGLLTSSDPVAFDEARFATLVHVLDLAHEHHLRVILDMHGQPSGNLLWTDFRHWETLIALWKEIARRVGGHPAVAGYDLLNEPNWLQGADSRPAEGDASRWRPPSSWKDTPRDYSLLMRRLTQAIREVDARTPLIVEGAGLFGKAINFLWLEPTGDKNTLYSFHEYMPHRFTDQGTQGFALGETYPNERFGKKELLATLQPVIDFQNRHRVPIFVGEFAPTRFAEPYGAARWLDDVVPVFEARGWHWAYWSFNVSDRSLELGAKDPERGEPHSTERLELMKGFWTGRPRLLERE